jgi:hypothetical protein
LFGLPEEVIMFNRRPIYINVEQPTEYLTREVHEHRAPTDESVRLLKELEEKARAKVIESIHIGDTIFECVVHVMQDVLNDATVFHAIFSLNGKRESVEYVSRDGDRTKAIHGLRDEIANVIANHMIISSIKKGEI